MRDASVLTCYGTSSTSAPTTVKGLFSNLQRISKVSYAMCSAWSASRIMESRKVTRALCTSYPNPLLDVFSILVSFHLLHVRRTPSLQAHLDIFTLYRLESTTGVD